MKLLETINVNKSYDNKAVLQNISIHLNAKETVCILGASGVGKTTLFNLIAGIEHPDTGKIIFKGQDITDSSGNISYMMQKDLLLPYRNILDNVSLPLIISGEKKAVARIHAEKLFKAFGLQGTQKQYPNELSGGMRQRAALLRTYLFNKEIMLLDEPFSALDTFTKRKMHDWFLQIMQEINVSSIFITHDIDEAIKLADRIYLLAGTPGNIAYEMFVGDIEKSDELSTEFLDCKKKIMLMLL